MATPDIPSAKVVARSPGPQASSLGSLARRVKSAVDAERELGHSLGKDQDAESLSRLKTSIQELIKVRRLEFGLQPVGFGALLSF